MTEQEPKEFNFEELEPLGFGNPESAISRKKQLKNGELTPEIDDYAQRYIQSGKAIVSITEIDDGCIDGRKAVEITYRNEDGDLVTVTLDNDGHERAKVAGGGYITSQAMRLGVGKKGDTAHEDILQTGEDLAKKGIFCGAHTGPHTHAEGATDCGANDKMDLILENALKVHTEDKDGNLIENGEIQILAATKKLIETAGLTFNETIFNKVIGNWRNVLSDKGYFGNSSGKARLQAAMDVQQKASIEQGGPKPPAVTKNLRGDHKEDYIIVNYVKGKTFSQTLMQKQLFNEFGDKDSLDDDPNLAQAFVVDAWRIVELAQAAVDEEEVEAAIYAGVMYQLATAATLTDGTLKMFAVTEKKDVALAA